MPLGTAFGTGFSAGSKAVSAGLSLKQKEEELAADKRAKQLTATLKNVKTIFDVAEKGVKGAYTKDPVSAPEKIQGYKEELAKQMKMSSVVLQALGQDPEPLNMQFNQIFDQPSPSDEAKAKAEATTLAQPVSSPEGKKIQDREVFKRLYGEDSEQLKAFDLAAVSAEADPSTVAGLRKEFTKQSDDFIKIRDAYGKIEIASKNPSAAGDLSMVFGIMKMFDPGSVVRESEQATAVNARGVPEAVRNIWNRLLSGERLGEDQRKDFVKTAENVMDSQMKFQTQLEGEYGRIAKQSKLDPTLVVVDFKKRPEQKEKKKVGRFTVEEM